MRYWLMKSEPQTFSIDDLKRVKTEPWDGVRNYQVRNMMRDLMQPGDFAFFYHSNCKVPGIVGTMTISSEAYPDPSCYQPKSPYFDPKSTPEAPRWLMVDVTFDSKFDEVIPLSVLRETPALENMKILQKGNRLSITPLTKKEVAVIQSLVH